MPSINLSGIISGSGVSGSIGISAGIGGVSVGAAVSINSSIPTVGLSMSRNTISPGVSGTGSKVSDPDVMSRIIDFSKAGNSNGAQTNGLRSNKNGSVSRLSSAKDILFPRDLDDQHYMTFRVVESHRKNVIETTKRMKVRSIILPVPSNLVAKYSADYENSEMGILASVASGDLGMADFKAAASSASDAIDQMGSGIKSMMGGASSGNAAATIAAAATVGVGTAIAAKILPGSLGKIAGTLAAATGAASVAKGALKASETAINPHMAVLFKGIGFKEHSFNFKFIPRTVDESEDIQELCRVFRSHMLPYYQFGSLAFAYPDEFQIIFSRHLAPYLFDIGNCVLKSFDVTYNGGGVPSFSKDGAPMEIDISLGFQEVNIETRNNTAKQTSTMFMASGFGGGKRPEVH